MSSNYYLKTPSPSLVSMIDYQTSNVSLDTSLTSLINSSSNTNTWFYALYQYWREDGDPRTIHFPLLEDGPIPLIIIMSIYFTFVTVIGPRIMFKRPAFVLRGPMLAYNMLMVALNAYFFYKMSTLCDFGRDFLKFEFPSKTDQSLRTLAIIDTNYLYFLTKFVDLLDTIFFVLRKKNNQITGLHLYHHTSVPFLIWLLVKLAPTAPTIQVFGLLNSFVHTVMYSYYALSAFGPSIQPYLWWKKYITQIQLAQFVVLIAYGVALGCFQTGYPALWFWIGFIQNPLFFFLFFDFYRNSYNKKKTTEVKKAK